VSAAAAAENCAPVLFRMFAPAGVAGGQAAAGALGLSLEDLRQAFREFDLDKNGCGQPHHATVQAFCATRADALAPGQLCGRR
jgi:hypothetical protein